MKKSLLLILVLGLVLAAGLSGYRVLHQAGSTDTAKVTAGAVSPSPAAVDSPSIAKPDPVAVPRQAIARNSSQPDSAVQVVSVPGDRFQSLDESLILDQRVTTVSKDRKKRELLVNAGGKYPFHRIEETLVKNEESDTYTISARTEMVANHVLVKLQAGKTADDLKDMLAGYGVSILRALSLPGHYMVGLKAPTLDAVPEALSVFGAESNVLAYVEPDYFSRINAAPNDSRWGELWGMVKINATGAWDATTGSTNVIVAVIDTGIDLTHPDLASNLWVNAAEAAGIPGSDDDGNGKIDDINGWDFVNEDKTPADDNSHGTHCAGTIGAVGNNNLGVAGVCWKIRLMTLKAGDASGRLADSDTVEAVQYAADNGAKIISASYGGSGSSDTVRSSISYANGKDVLFVAAAGNDGLDNDSTPHYPSSYDLPNVVAVAASDPSDLLASFSNYGKTSVDLAAPGVGILSTVLNGNYEEKQGTSMATPHVAGAAALLLSAKPGLTHLQLKQTLLDTVDPVASLAAKTVSGGRLNVKRMIALLDTDGDGMPDEWETANAAAGLNPLNPNDADLDPDADHLTNREEYENGCDPGDADTDGDSLLDGWEVTYGFNPNSPSGGLPSSSRLGGFNTSGSAENIVVSGNYAYVADGANGLVILNIANPENPVMVGAYDHPEVGIAKDITFTNGYAYVADGANGLVIVNVANPATPTLAGWTNTVGTATGIAIQSNYVYIADGANELIIFDVSTPMSPQYTGKTYTLRKMYDVFVRGTSAYLAENSEVRRVNVSNPVSPQSDASAATFSDMLGIHGNGSVIAAAAGVGGVKIMNTSLGALGSFDTDGTASGVFVDGNNLYVADGTNGLVVLNISSPTNPVQTARIVTESEAVGVFVSGGYAYVAEGTGGIEIFSVLPDSDGDGLLDSWELEQFSNLSRDGSGDFDNDGILDRGEYLAGLNPKNADQDGDGLTDGTQEVIVYNTDPRSVDTDGDRLADGYDGFVSTNVYAAGIDVDLDRFVDGELDAGTETSPTLADTDGDGMNDGWEHRYGLNPNVPGGSGDGDGDDLTDIEESQNNTDPSNRDTDGDGMWDGWEVHNGLNPLLNDARGDPDGDGLLNVLEYSLCSNSLWGVVYTNLVGAPAILTTNMLGSTDPKNRDSDSDGMPDGWEVSYSLAPLVKDATGDPDNDGLNNLAEYQNGTNPRNVDSDEDDMPDGWEVGNGLLASAGAGATGSNGAGGDPDGDKLLNLQEYNLISSNLWLTVYTSVTGAPASFWFSTNGVHNGVPGSTNPRNADSDGDGLTDYYEITTNATGNLYITDPNNIDTDDDGFSDSWEISHINPPGPATFNPTFKEDSGITDRDNDGLFDAEEIVLGTQPYNPNDPVFVDDDGSGDPWPLDPQSSDPVENGTKNHPFDAIQEAVNVASNGMTILISDGTYWGTGNYNINPQGKAITIKSWSNDRALVTVNSLGYGPVFVMNSGETTNTILKGLGIKVTLSACSDGDCDHEHGITLGNASPRIENCMIFDSELDGIHCETNSNPVIIGCVISSVLNGIWCESGSSPRIQNCTITDVGHGLAGDVGIGIYADSSSGVYIGGNSVVSNCNGRGIVLKNSANAIIEDTDLFNCSGGITLDNSSPRIERCILQNNQAPNYYVNSNNIAVVAAQLFPDDLEREKDTTKEDENGGAILMMRGSSPFIVNCLAVNNRTWAEDPNYSKLKLSPDFGLGGGFYVGDGCSPTGVNCTVADNHANTLGGGLSSHQSPFLRNMIFWGNTASNATVVGGKRFFSSANSLLRNLHCRSGSINIWYSNIEGSTWPGGYPTAVLSTNGNPRFIGGGDYRLQAGSPCIDKGTFYLAPKLDLVGNQRTNALPGRVDMGCYEFGATSPTLDTDGDGVSDIAELAQGTNPNNSDTDGDGFTDGAEDITGTDPLSAVSYFDVGASNSPAGNVLLIWESVSGRLYTVQTRTNLILGVWSNAPGYTDLSGTGFDMYFTNSLPDVVRYYRIQVRLP